MRYSTKEERWWHQVPVFLTFQAKCVTQTPTVVSYDIISVTSHCLVTEMTLSRMTVALVGTYISFGDGASLAVIVCETGGAWCV
jgi:hypothetical protein